MHMKKKTTELQIAKEELVDINTVHINSDLPVKERISDFLGQIKNPYRYIDGDTVVTIRFSNQDSFESRLLQYLTEKREFTE